MTKTDSEGQLSHTHGLIDVSHKDPMLTAFILLVQTARETMRYKDAAFYRKAGLSDIKFMALMAIHFNSNNSNKAMTTSQLAQWTQTKPHNITTLVRRLQKDGLVKAERDKVDRRFTSITMTDKGLETLNRAIPVAREIISQVMSSFSEEDTAQITDYLQVLRNNAHNALKQVEGNQ